MWQSPLYIYVQVNVAVYPVYLCSGKCGSLPCDGRFYDTPATSTCYANISTNYKFYLAFENSICPHYVTEKSFRTLLWGVVPIVMATSDITEHLPPNSYIDVSNFTSPQHLATYLQLLDKRDDLYNRYFEWRKHYEVVITDKISKDFLCNICDLVKRTQNVKPKSKDFLPWFDSLGKCENSTEFGKRIGLSEFK